MAARKYLHLIKLTIYCLCLTFELKVILLPFVAFKFCYPFSLDFIYACQGHFLVVIMQNAR